MTSHPLTRDGPWAVWFVLPLLWALFSLSVQAYTPGPFVDSIVCVDKGNALP